MQWYWVVAAIVFTAAATVGIGFVLFPALPLANLLSGSVPFVIVNVIAAGLITAGVSC